MNSIKQFDIWTADLDMKMGTEPGKIRPVIVVQSDFLNNHFPSTIVCPVTSQVEHKLNLLRVPLNDDQLKRPSQIIVDQLRAIHNSRFRKRIGRLTSAQSNRLRENLKIVMDL